MLITRRYFWIIPCFLAGGVSAVAQTQSYSRQHLRQVVRPHFKKDTFNIINYITKADGFTLNTKSINITTADCSATEKEAERYTLKNIFSGKNGWDPQ